MKILVAATSAQAELLTQDSDFFHATEGEIVGLPTIVCEGSPEYRNTCGCGRSFSGLTTGLATTIAQVAEKEEEALIRLFAEGRVAQSWTKDLSISVEELFEHVLKPLVDGLDEMEVGQLLRINTGEDRFVLYAAEEPILEQT